MMLFLFAVTLFFQSCISAVPVEDIKGAISYLKTAVLSSQVPVTKDYVPGLQEAEIKGLYPSYIHLNFHGGKNIFLFKLILIVVVKAPSIPFSGMKFGTLITIFLSLVGFHPSCWNFPNWE
jgi:hypothetical protein